jgi:uncharacterized protein YjbI with pentapeptide repeats
MLRRCSKEVYGMDKERLQKVLNEHEEWLKTRFENEVKGRRADLRGANLSDADLRGADLMGADLSGANLSGADLSDADLRGADLSDADLRGADLMGADLSGANLSGADLSDADLRGADLMGADLSDADLSGADLSDADLRGADLMGADLSDADLRGADLSDADLRGADLDYSCLPLWCGSLHADFDDKQIIQLTYHLASAGLSSKNVSGDVKEQLNSLVDLANRFHRVGECGELEVWEKDEDNND